MGTNKEIFAFGAKAFGFNVTTRVKFCYIEDVNSHSNRVKKLYYSLCNANTENETEREAEIVRKTFKSTTLQNFIQGLITLIQTIVKARNPETLKQEIDS